MKSRFQQFGLLVLVALGIGCSCGNPVSSFNSRPAAFSVTGTTALMSGLIVADTPTVLSDLIAEHPEVDTIVLINVVGSLDTEATFVAGRMLRQHGLNTHVPTNGVIASGGTDLFISGTLRTIEFGAQIGVHSWETDGDNGQPIIGRDLPDDHPFHQFFINYYREMGLPDTFYRFAIRAAGPKSIHWMTQTELRQFGLIASGTINN